jgi:hypothetical protein
MTMAELSTLVVSWLDDPSQGYFTTKNVNTWLNLAQRQVQMKLLQAGQNWYMKPVTTTTVSGQSDYVLPSDFIIEHRLEAVLSGTGTNESRQALLPVTTNEQDLITISLGNPTNYSIKKDRVVLYPTPQSVLTLRLYYSPRVADMSLDTDSPDVPEQFMEYVALLAAYDGFIKDDRTPENLVQKMVKYEELLKEMANNRTQDSPRRVVMVNDYDYSGSFW